MYKCHVLRDACVLSQRILWGLPIERLASNRYQHVTPQTRERVLLNSRNFRKATVATLGRVVQIYRMSQTPQGRS